jgi:hypothetical protein
MRACEQDRKMAALLGIDTDRTISLTFVIGAALAAVAGTMYLLRYGVIDFYIGFLAGVKAFTAAVLGGIGSLPGAVLGGLLIGLIETFWSAYFSVQYKDVAAFSILVLTLIFLPTGLHAGRRSRRYDPRRRAARRRPRGARRLGLFAPLVGLRTDVSPTGGLFLRTRWADVAIVCGIVFLGRLVLSLWLGQRGLRPSTGPGPWTARLERAGAFVAPVLLGLAVVLPFIPASAATNSTSASWCSPT